MLELLLTIMTMYVGIAVMVLTDRNSEKYTNYQIRRFLRQAKIQHQ